MAVPPGPKGPWRHCHTLLQKEPALKLDHAKVSGKKLDHAKVSGKKLDHAKVPGRALKCL